MTSRLPTDERYWAALIARIAAQPPARRWWHALARFSTPLVIGAAAAVLVALLWMPPPARASGRLYDFTPRDPLAVALLETPEAPTMAILIATSTSESVP